jgi:hypothetical protein
LATEPKKGLLSGVSDNAIRIVQTCISVGAIVFAGGSLSGEVKDMKAQLANVQTTQIQQAAMTVDIKTLRDQIDESKEVQRLTNDNLGKLSDAVNNLSVQLARQEGRQDRHK